MNVMIFERNEKNQFLVERRSNNKIIDYIVCEKSELGRLCDPKFNVGRHYNSFTNALFYLRREINERKS